MKWYGANTGLPIEVDDVTSLDGPLNGNVVLVLVSLDMIEFDAKMPKS